MAALCIAGSAVAAVFSTGLLIRKGRTAVETSMAILIAALAAALAVAAVHHGRDPAMELSPLPLLIPLALIGIMIHRLFMELARLSTERKRQGMALFLLLLPAVLSDVLVHGFSMQDSGLPVWGIIIPGLHIVVALCVIAPCIAALFHVFGYYTPETMSGTAWAVLGVSGAVLAAILTGLVGIAIGDSRLYAVIEGFASIAIIAGALAFFRWPDALGRFREETVRQRYAKSLLAGLDVEGLIRGMNEMVKKSGLYKSESCSLDGLAGRMGLTRHQVSELLNDRMGTNYANFINGFRIDEARDLLLSRPDETVLAIALEVGFGNKTSFNDAFRCAVGMSPTEFRKER